MTCGRKALHAARYETSENAVQGGGAEERPDMRAEEKIVLLEWPPGAFTANDRHLERRGTKLRTKCSKARMQIMKTLQANSAS